MKKFLVLFPVLLLMISVQYVSAYEGDIQFTFGTPGGAVVVDGLEDCVIDAPQYGIKNYNFLTDNFGFGIQTMFGDQMEFAAGPAFRIKANDLIHFQFLTAVHMSNASISRSTSDDIHIEETYTTEIKTFGFMADAQFKITASRKCSPLLGVSVFADPFADRKIVHTRYTFQNAVEYNGEVVAEKRILDFEKGHKLKVNYSVCPYVAFCINF